MEAQVNPSNTSINVSLQTVKTMSKYKIEKNELNGGKCCRFKHNNKEYYADRAYIPFCGLETMISEAKNGEVTNWSGLYCDRSGKSLEQCIDEFIQSLE